MPFPQKVAEILLIKCARHCCGCRQFKGTHLIIHHIIQESHGGPDTEDNGIPLCFDCHMEVASYNNDHPGGRMYCESELRKLRKLWFDFVEKNPNLPATKNVQTILGNNNIVGHQININPRIVTKSVVQPGSGHISDEQAMQIRQRILDLAKGSENAGRGSSPAKWYSKLYKHFRVTSYKLVPADRFEEAIAWLQKQGALQRPNLRRSSNTEWRKSFYKGIWSRAKEIGMEKNEVYAFAFRRLELANPIDSLRDLGEQNLEALYRAIFALRRGENTTGLQSQ